MFEPSSRMGSKKNLSDYPKYTNKMYCYFFLQPCFIVISCTVKLHYFLFRFWWNHSKYCRTKSEITRIMDFQLVLSNSSLKSTVFRGCSFFPVWSPFSRWNMNPTLIPPEAAIMRGLLIWEWKYLLKFDIDWCFHQKVRKPIVKNTSAYKIRYFFSI